jgi:hypothetical protein
MLRALSGSSSRGSELVDPEVDRLGLLAEALLFPIEEDLAE